MTVTARQRNHTVEIRNLLRRWVVADAGALASLEVTVVAPAPNRAVTHERQTVALSRGDACHAAGQACDLKRIRVRIETGAATARTELAIEVNAPGPHGAVLFNCE